MSQLEKDGFLATQLIGLMVRSARQDREHTDPAIKQSASEWLQSNDAGLASLETGCQHLGYLSMRVPPTLREVLSQTLGLSGHGDSLQQSATWRDIAQDPRLPDSAIMSSIETLACECYPSAAPEDYQQKREAHQQEREANKPGWTPPLGPDTPSR